MTRVLRPFVTALLAAGIAAAMLPGCASPQAAGAPELRASAQEAPPSLDPQVARILRSMCDTLDGAKAMHFRVQATLDRPIETGQLAQFHRTSEVTAVRPDKLYATTVSDDGNWSIWQRGTTLNALDKDGNVYATETVPADIGDMLDDLVDKYDLVMPMADLLAGKTYAALTGKVESAEYLGIRNVADTKCNHLLFRQENIDWQIWIQTEGPALPRKMVITYLLEPDQPQYAATIDQWELAPAVSEDTFKFTAPAGATAVSFQELINENEEH